MAIVILGKTPCLLCGEVIREGQEVVAFPLITSNELDPLWKLSDGAFHAECFRRHPQAGKATARYVEIQERTGPGHRYCIVCGGEVTQPDQYFTLGHLTDDRRHPLYQHNYSQFHRACLANWTDLEQVSDQLEVFERSGAWRGEALGWILDILRGALQARRSRGLAPGHRVAREPVLVLAGGGRYRASNRASRRTLATGVSRSASRPGNSVCSVSRRSSEH
jgi:hypothetical protein